MDADSGNPVPYANVFFTGTTIGTATDFDGNYSLETSTHVDSISVSYVGYLSKTKVLQKGLDQTIYFQLREDAINLDVITITAKEAENPAFEIMRKVIDHKKYNDKQQLDAYEYETYTKIEIDVDNLSEKFRKRKIISKIKQVLDSVEQIAGEDGKPILPIFISESISNYYYRNNPKLRHEKINKTKISGVGIEDGTLTSQFIGSSFQEYNFYQNWLHIVDKEFISPIADGWRFYYNYDLMDSSFVGEDYCYRLDFSPKSTQDLAFTGSMWITKGQYALKQIDVAVSATANLNYIEKIKIQQELSPTEAGPWIPIKNRVLIDVGEITKNSAGMLAKFYTSNRNISVNLPKALQFYEQPISVAEDSNEDSDALYWQEHRHEKLTSTEENVFKMIDTLKTIPVVKTYTEIFKVLAGGYKKVGKIDLGPYISSYARNDIEGHRFQLGFRTNIGFSNKWVLGGRIAYGTEDEKFKYGAFAKYILSRRHWTIIKFSYDKDIDQVGLSSQDLLDFTVFQTATRFGTLIKPYWYEQSRVSLKRELFKGFTQKVSFTHRTFDPLYPFGFFTALNTENSSVERHFETSEVTIETRFAKDELFIISDNNRLSLGPSKWPIITVRYTQGLKGVLGSDFQYHKLMLGVRKRIKMGFFGTSDLSLNGGHIFDPIPYPLLKAHIGNESNFYTTAAYNLMDFSEFISDAHLELRYQHFFQGFVLNRLPLMRKLKWRLVGNANVLYGSLKEANRSRVPSADRWGRIIDQPLALDDGPYIELGYGIENILKIIRLDAFHRLTYLDRPGVRKFGVKISFQFIL